jgi:signal transduction histidine kinase
MDQGFAPERQVHDLAIARRMGTASDDRRRAVERILHDGVQQHMALMGLRLSILQRRINTAPDEATKICEELRSELADALAELRAVAHLIYPAILENEGLGAALDNAAARIGVHTVIDIHDEQLPIDIRQAFYFCCLEAIDNAGKHGAPGVSVSVRVGVEDGRARFEVVDNGSGFAVDSARVFAGLQHIKDRVEALGGAFDLTSTPEGTRVAGTVPLDV